MVKSTSISGRAAFCAAVMAAGQCAAAESGLRTSLDVELDEMTLRPSIETLGAPSLVDPIHLRPPYATDDGLTIVTEAGRIRLAGVEGPSRRAICLDGEEKMWACGLQARAALANLIRAQEVTCRRTTPAPGEIPSATCSIGAQDLAQALVADGFARPVGGPGPLSAPLELARSERRGLWNGGWSIRR